jgi:hypothetical protein
MPAKKNLTVRLDDETREILELISDREMRPLANQINFFIKQSINTYLDRNCLMVEPVDDPETGEHIGSTLIFSPPVDGDTFV